MAIRTKLLNKINQVLTRFKVYHGSVYKRTIEQFGGDPLLGKPASVSKNDLIIIPPPAVFYPKYQGISQNNDPFIIGGVAAQVGDVVFLLSVDAITEDELADPGFCFVIINDKYEEEFYIIASDRIHVEEQILAYQFLVRSRTRTP